MDGEIDEVRLWNTARGAAQISNSMNRVLSGSETGLAAYYRFDETSGTLLPDHAGNNHDGTLVNMGGNEWSTPGAPLSYSDPVAGFGTALAFDGADDSVQLPTNLTSEISGGNALTIEYWFKGSELQSPVRFQDVGGYIVAGWGAGGPQHIISTDGETAGISCGDESVIEDGRWHHLAMTWQQNTSNGFRSYLDGELVTQRNSADATLPVLAGMPYLGSYNGSSEFLAGTLDEARIWDSALSANSITNWMYREVDMTHPAHSNLVAYYQLDEGSGTNSLDSAGSYDGVLTNMASSAWVASDVPGDYTVFDGHTVTGRLVGSDADGSSSNGTDWTLSFEVVEQGSLGVATTTVDNIFEYTAHPDVAGTDSFTYRVRDGGGQTSTTHSVAIFIPVAEHTGDSPVHYVSTNGLAVWPYTNWTDAATSVQDAVDTAATGDTILVKYGAYAITSSLALSGKDIQLSSDDGDGTGWGDADYDRNQTTIAANDNSRLFTITGSGVTSNTTLRGFTFTDGDASDEATGAGCGGGIYLASGAAPIIENVTVSNCAATTNTGANGYGGGLYICDEAQPTLDDLLIIGNTASVSGGGIGTDSNSTNVFHITDCIIADNVAGQGGGISSWSCALQISGCDIRNNQASGDGGGVFFFNADGVVLENSLIRGNAGNRGGGIYVDADVPAFRHNTFYANSATYGSGLYCNDDSSPIIENNIFVNHTTGDGRAIYSRNSGFSVDYNCFHNNMNGNHQTADSNSVTDDPLFVNPTTDENGDFHLKSEAGRWNGSAWVTDADTSPCIDAGNPASDYANEPENNGDQVNLGRYGNTTEASKGGVPAVTTVAIVTDITATSATAGGDVTDQGDSAVTARGVCWNTNGSPTTADEHTIDGSGIGSFTSTITGLTSQTTYCLRAYAANAYGTAYGEQRVFTTGGWAPPGNALDFDGTNDYAEIADHDDLDLTAGYTIECWFKADSFDSLRGLVSKFQTAGSNGYLLRLNGTELDFDELTTTGLGLTADCWYHVAAVNDSGSRTLYVNGTATAVSGTAITVATNTDPIRIGSDFGGRFFDGQIDEVRIWDDARTANEILDHMHRELDGDEDGLIAYYPMNQTSIAGLNDVSENGHDGSIQGAALTAGTSPFPADITDETNIRAAWAGKNDPTHASSILTLTDTDIAGTDFVAFGHDEGSLAMTNTSCLAQFAALDRTWRLEESGELVLDLAFDCTEISDITNPNRLYLLVDDDGDFSNAAIYVGVYNASTLTYSSHAVQDGGFYTIAEPSAGTLVWFVDAAAATSGNGISWDTPFRTIQEGIDTAGDGDTILVKYGAYAITNSLTLSGKDVQLSSDDGDGTGWDDADYDPVDDTHLCTINANDNGRLFTITGSGVTSNTIIRGFTFTDGDASDETTGTGCGGGIYLASGASLIIEYATVSSCAATTNTGANGYGGGLYITDAPTAPTIRHTTITDNIAGTAGGSYGHGGGLCISEDAQPTLDDLLITNNLALSDDDRTGRGGGCYFDTLNNCTLNNCTLSGNWAKDEGGGSFYGTLNNSTLSGNSADYSGGGCYISTLNNCTLTGNSAVWGGGSAHSTLNNCMLSDNSAELSGGGSDRCTLNNCTLTGNSAVGGGGSYMGELNNCIVWGNAATNSGQQDISFADTVSHTCASDGVTHGVNGCITTDPLFVSTNDLRLLPGSPCINTGTNQVWMANATDLDGSPRIVNTTVDMGGYEYIHSADNYDGDAFSNADEATADTDPTDSGDWFHVTSISNSTVGFNSSSNRLYTLYSSTNLVIGHWSEVTNRMGVGGADSMSGTNNAPLEFFKLEVELP